MCVDARANGRTALGKRSQSFHRVVEPPDSLVDLELPGADFLSQRHRHRIHKMRAPGLYDPVRFLGLGFKRRRQVAQGR